ncbi:MAG TPA: hypothetical protein VKB77_01725, partial [Terriglobales bacterium]|nr:hypothetical protein [Terriglobales bacterium]
MYRQTASTSKWDVAAKQARNIEAKYEAALVGKPAPPSAGITIEQAVRLYLVDRESQHLKRSTISKLETIFEKQMVTW